MGGQRPAEGPNRTQMPGPKRVRKRARTTLEGLSQDSRGLAIGELRDGPRGPGELGPGRFLIGGLMTL